MLYNKNCDFRKKYNTELQKCTIDITFLLAILFILSYLIVLVVYFYNLTKKKNNMHKIELYKSRKWDDIISGCYYINLDRSTKRKEYMENMLEKENIKCERFSAIDGNNHLHLCQNLKIPVGALGCKLSHLEVLKKVKKNGWTIIFEDDIDLGFNSKENILKIISSLPSTAELVLFGTSPRKIALNICTFNFKKYNDFVWQTDNNLSCAHAYAITYGGAQKWIESIEKNLCDTSFDMHEKNIKPIYFSHSFTSNLSDIFKMFFKDYSFIPQNKDKFGYFESTILDFNI